MWNLPSLETDSPQGRRRQLPRTAGVRRTNLRRDEPSPELFIIPYDYTLLDPQERRGTEDPWSIDSTPERYVVDLAAGRVKR